jgi:hypothetical protein
MTILRPPNCEGTTNRVQLDHQNPGGMTTQKPPDCDAILSHLKDFQRKTVDYVFHRLYTDDAPTRRFLVADEVGLGKTLVARGVIAKAANHLWNRGHRIDVIYICSNADIARQNVGRLNIFEDEDVAIASRITLLPAVIKKLKNKKVNLVSLTPGTSFDLKSGMGIGEERALLYWMLKDSWSLKGKAPLNVLAGQMSPGNFEQLKDRYANHDIDLDLKESFLTAIQRQIDDDNSKGNEDIKVRFERLCKSFSKSSHKPSDEEELARRNCISELRNLLARSCLCALEPDIIILDEFQRFKYLMYGDDSEREPARELADQLFSYADANSNAKVLLLSATPYKMYTLSDESGIDDHYKDFLNTLGFLQQDQERTHACEKLLKDYRYELFHIANGDFNRLLSIKGELEEQFRRIMVRTERLAVSKDRNGMLEEKPSPSVKVDSKDLLTYCKLQKIANILEKDGVLEYWKSSPYLLNFMENYELKQAFSLACNKSSKCKKLYQEMASFNGLLLPWNDIFRYKEIDSANPRLRSQIVDLIDRGAWQLLWVPPALPYYGMDAPFSDLSGFTKRLVFSSWKVVPKMAASMISYEAERRMMTAFDPKTKNTPEAKKRFSPLLRFARSSDKKKRPIGMQVLGLIYPSLALAKACDPLSICISAKDSDKNRLISIKEAQGKAKKRIEELLAPLIKNVPKKGPEDEDWYWAAPILLDLSSNDSENIKDIFNQINLAEVWRGGSDWAEQEEEETTQWHAHVSEAKKLLDHHDHLGRPPHDLSEVLAKMALAGPGITSLRALARVTGGLRETGGLLYLSPVDIWISASQISFAFRHLFNLPAATNLIRGLNLNGAQKELPYWRMVLDYCLKGCLQATLDEYAHFLLEYEGLFNQPHKKIACGIASAIREALTLRTASLNVEEINLDSMSKKISLIRNKMRTQFALRLADEESDDGKIIARSAQVRCAFNSPFWPFVLITTSVGQEGLDFHPYCHAIVHWNLPANPVDLEQREGRIHRYKGHAIRKNLALHYGVSELNANDSDPWETLFSAGVRDHAKGTGDLVPFWIYPLDNGAKIERYVPALPLSKDLEHLNELHRSLAVYRMVFGQPRQEDLTAYLRRVLTPERIDQIAEKLRFDLSPPSSLYPVKED